jgi:hypothetical protein
MRCPTPYPADSGSAARASVPNRWAAKSFIGVSELIGTHNTVSVLTRNINVEKI